MSLAILVVGLVLLFFGINASDSLSSNVSETVHGAPSDKAIWLIALGGLGSLIGLGGLIFGRREK